jgi:hypothetical protein
VRLQVTPVAGPAAPQSGNLTEVQPEAAPVYAQPAPVYSQPAPVYVQPAQVVTQVIQPVAPVYYVRPYYPPIGVNLNLGWSNWNGHRGHGHWR